MTNFTEEQKRWIVTDFARRKRISSWLFLPAFASSFVLVYLYNDPHHEIPGFGWIGPLIVAAVVGLASFVLINRFYRCPACGGQHGLRSPRACRTCGAPLLPPPKISAALPKMVKPGAAPAPPKRAATPAKPKAAAPPQSDAASPAKAEGAETTPAAAAEERVAAPTRQLTPVELWAVAVSANLTITWERGFNALALPNGQEKAREVLGRQWSLHGRKDAEEIFGWLRHEGHSAGFEQILEALAKVPPERLEGFIVAQDRNIRRGIRFVAEHGAEVKGGKLTAWDAVRLAFLARATFTAGWLDEEAAWKIALEAARKLQRSYDSWAELSENFLLGRGFWGEASPESMADFRKNADWLLTSERSPWTQLPWDLPLAEVNPS